MRVIYVLCPSRSVGMNKLMSLYRVPAQECISMEQYSKTLGSGTEEEDTPPIYLYPRDDGKYEEIADVIRRLRLI